MSIHIVTKLGQTKAGKPVVYLDGRTDWRDMVFLGQTIPPPAGLRIEAEISSTPTRDGKGTMRFLNQWKIAEAQGPALPPLPAQQPSQPIAAPPPSHAVLDGD